MTDLVGRHERTIVDLGTGDGAAVLRLARRQPAALVIGVDTNAASMREASDRASRKPARGGVPNAIFLSGTLEELAALGPLAGAVAEVRVTLPWGSLLRAAAIPERTFMASLATLMQPGGRLQLLLSIAERDSDPALPGLSAARAAALAREYEAAGFSVAAARPATPDDVESSGSSWAKRLGVAMRREAWLFETFVGSRESPTTAVSDPARD